MIKRSCLICRKRFSVNLYREKTAKFCSKKCLGIWNSYNLKGNKCHFWKGGKITKKCLICGKYFNIHPSTNKKTCSKVCGYKYLGQSLSQQRKGKYFKGYKFPKGYTFWKGKTGKNNPNWRGGKQRNKHNGNQKYKNWRKSIFEYDSYICWICGKKGNKLNAHHLKSWAQYPELRYNINNGITLCEKCHKIYTL